ncbi:MAG: type II toxin-antitoxin system VapC family toxin [Puniceicoccaceae bacterium]
MDLIADTSFLVGLWQKQDWALRFASLHSRKVLGIPWVVLGEFWHGAQRAGHDFTEVEQFLALGLPLTDAGPVFSRYAEICADLQNRAQETYRQIGQNDLWIAATAAAHNSPLVTRNERHFRAIQGVELLALQ